MCDYSPYYFSSISCLELQQKSFLCRQTVFVLVNLKLSDLYFLNRNTIACKKIFPIPVFGSYFPIPPRELHSTSHCHTGKDSHQTISKGKASPVIQNKSNLLPPRNKYLNIPEHTPRKKPEKTNRVSLTAKPPPVVHTQSLARTKASLINFLHCHPSWRHGVRTNTEIYLKAAELNQDSDKWCVPAISIFKCCHWSLCQWDYSPKANRIDWTLFFNHLM